MKLIHILSFATLGSALAISKRDKTEECLLVCVASVEGETPICGTHIDDPEEFNACICGADEDYWIPLWDCVKGCPSLEGAAGLEWATVKENRCAEFKEPEETKASEETEEPKEPEESKEAEVTQSLEPEVSLSIEPETEIETLHRTSTVTVCDNSTVCATVTCTIGISCPKDGPYPVYPEENSATILGVGSFLYLFYLAIF